MNASSERTDSIRGLVTYLRELNKKDPKECNKVIDLMADYYLEADEEEMTFWNEFLTTWKKDMS